LARVNDTWEYYPRNGRCVTDDQCTSGYCVDGVCCDSPCGGGDPNDCIACSVAAGALEDGVCGVVVDGNPCQDGDACTEGDTCQAGICEPGAPVTCRAPDVCELSLGCNPSVGCVYEEARGHALPGGV